MTPTIYRNETSQWRALTGSGSNVPISSVVAASDTFTRTVGSGGLGTADTGGAWTIPVGTAANFSTNGSRGLCSLPSGVVQGAVLAGASITTGEWTLDLIPLVLPTSGVMYGFVWLRVASDVSAFYRIGVFVDSAGVVSLRGEVVPGAPTVLGDTSIGVTVTAGTAIHLKVQAVGVNPTVIRAKAWTSGSEPVWQSVGQDSTAAVQTAGAVGIRMLASLASAQWGFDNFSASTTLSTVTTPSAPGTPTASAGGSSATVSFVPSPDDGGALLNGCRITPYIAGVAQTAQVFANTATTQTVTGLTNGTAYTFKVETHNNSGYSALSAASNAVTPATAGPPNAPTSPSASGGSASAIVSVTAPANNGSAITSYDVQPFIGTSGQTVQNFIGAGTTFSVTGLTNGTTYTFKVRANNTIGSGAYSASSNAVTPATISSGTRGPNGTHWPPNTPAYSSTPNLHATPSTLVSVLAGASSGDVIGMAAGTYNGLVLSGSSSWATNVLIKPDTGVSRASIIFTGQTWATGGHFTLAGVGNMREYKFNGADRCFLAWTRMNGSTSSDYSRLDCWGSNNCGMYEVVRAQTYLSPSGDDQMQIMALGGNFFADGAHPKTNGFDITGCYLAGNVTTNPNDHCDNIQLGSAANVRLTDTIQTMGSNSSIQCEGAATSGPIIITNCYAEGADHTELVALTGNSSSIASNNVAYNAGQITVDGSKIVGIMNYGSNEPPIHVRNSQVRGYANPAPSDQTGTTVNSSLAYARPSPPSDTFLTSVWGS